jgi:hypothetical protein
MGTPVKIAFAGQHTSWREDVGAQPVQRQIAARPARWFNGVHTSHPDRLRPYLLHLTAPLFSFVYSFPNSLPADGQVLQINERS